ncbi:MAG: DUF5711 family protein [Firmicutes bacterium]|nr:DUF5711 family protein [Bacillota bacterium]
MTIKTKLLIFVGLITIVLMVQFLLPFFGQSHVVRMEPGYSIPFDLDANPSFHSNNSRFFYLVTRSGVQYRRVSDMSAHWTESIGFTRAMTVARGDIIAVGEQSGGRSVHVFNPSGLMFTAEFDDPIVSFFVNETGFLSVILQTSFGYRIYVHNQQSIRAGVPLYSQNIADALVFPLAVDVSENGRYIAVAIVDVNVWKTTTIQFRYINDSDARAAGVDVHQGLFAAVMLEELIYTIRFMADNRLIIATPSEIRCYQIITRPYLVSEPQRAWTINLQNELSHIGFDGNRHLVYVTGDRHLNTLNGSSVGTVYIVNMNGTHVGEFNLGRRATHLSVGHGAVIVGSDRNFHAIDLRGNHLWEHNSLHYTSDMLFIDGTNTVLVVGANRAEVNVRRRVRVNEFENVFDTLSD